MKVGLYGVSKSFGNHTVLKNLVLDIPSGSRIAVTGGNGSGKSTLIKVIAGFLIPDSGTVLHELNGRSVDADSLYRYVSLATPDSELTEEMTVKELFEIHFGFKPLQPKLNIDDVHGLSGLTSHLSKKIFELSSGLRQRLKLSLAIFSDTPLLLLDEPHNNLDAEAVAWFQSLMNNHTEDKTIVICSNHREEEYISCQLRKSIASIQNGNNLTS